LLENLKKKYGKLEENLTNRWGKLDDLLRFFERWKKA
jgi:hypothetical protein